METLGLFPDLPRIDFQESDFRQHPAIGQESDLYWPSLKPQDSPYSMPATPELDLTAHQRHLHMSSKQRYPAVQDPSGAFASFAPWTTELSQSHGRIRPLPSQCDGLNPLPYNLAIPRDASPDGWWTGDRPAMEQDSCSGGSTWSPRTSEGRLEMVPRSASRGSWSECRDHAPAGNFAGFPAQLPKYGAYSTHSTATSIAPSVIQIYPDPESDAMSVNSTMREMHSDPYGAGPPGLLRSQVEPMTYVDDETISSVPDEEDVPMDDDTKDDGSDYTPHSKPSHRRNPSRTLSTPLPRRPARTAKAAPAVLAKPSKITKRGPSAKTVTPTLPSSSPVASRSGTAACSQCSATFGSVSTLHKHTLASHTRPFTCSFHRYGCPATFGSKNEWKRHVSSQHLRPGIYRCDIGACVPLPNQHRRKSSTSSVGYQKSLRGPTGGDAAAATGAGHNDFNRKDLFTQHVRRMHGPHATAPRAEKDAFDASLETTQQRCWIALRESPPRSTCGFCLNGRTADVHEAGEAEDDATEGKEVVFEGSGAWDDRMEHVGKHLERGETGEREDEGLRDWMVRQGLVSMERGAWRVVGCGGRRRGRGASDASADKGDRDGAGGEDGEEDGECDDE
ncbi:hypothetical protein MMC07_008456 [Pseudocyphellaria aurata]|nr:hypothetical protein [Pseudocyphellaria aurata]